MAGTVRLDKIERQRGDANGVCARGVSSISGAKGEDLLMPPVLEREKFFPWAVTGAALVLIIADFALIWILF